MVLSQHAVDDPNLPLRGVRVADFGWIGVGSYTTKLLADHGAEVTKIETSTYLDSLRNAAPFKDGIKGINRSGYFAERNANKRSLTLNLKHPSARSLALRLIAGSDVVANNFTPGTMERLGLGYEDVCQVRPDIIYISMSMHGSDGPESRQSGYGLTVAAASALYYLSGTPGREPSGSGTNYPDHIPSPCHAAFAVLAALRHRSRTGRGQRIDLAETESTIALIGPAVLDFTVNGCVQIRSGNKVKGAAPSGVYPCLGEDRWIAITIVDDESWRALLDELGSPEALTSAAFASSVSRQDHEDELNRLIASRTRGRDAYDLMERLQARGVAAGVVQTAEDLIVRDCQLKHRNHWIWLDHPEMGRSIYSAQPIRLGPRPQETLRKPAPLLGQHTREVCADLLGLGESEVDQLINDGVLI